MLVNVVIAALAAAEFMMAVTGLRAPTRHYECCGWESKVVVIANESRADCLYSTGIYGKLEEADVGRCPRFLHLRNTQSRSKSRSVGGGRQLR